MGFLICIKNHVCQTSMIFYNNKHALDVNKAHGFVSHKTQPRFYWSLHLVLRSSHPSASLWWWTSLGLLSCQVEFLILPDRSGGSTQLADVLFGRWTRSLEESYKQLSNLIKLYGWWMIAFNLFQILLLLKSNKYPHFFTPSSSELFHMKIFTCTSSRYFRRILLYLYCIIL